MDAFEPAQTGSSAAQDVSSAPLGPDFARAQLAQIVSLIADHSLMWILMWWLFRTRQNPNTDEVLSLLSPGLLLLCAVPIAGTWADQRDRKHVARWACCVRALCHLAILGMLYSRTLTVDRSLVFLWGSALAGSFFDASFTPMLPQLVPDSQAERALDYSLALPRAGYFITGFILVLLLAMLGERMVCLLGVVFLLLAAVLVGNIQANTQPRRDPAAPRDPSSLAWLRAFLDGPRVLLGSRKLLWVALLSMLANFLMYPLFWLGPGSLVKGHRLPKTLPENIEVVLVVGVVLGALATPRLCRRYAAEKIAAASLLGMSVGLLGLGLLHSEQALYLTAGALGFFLVQITGLAGGSATLSVADSHRARIGALVLILFELGGELGAWVLRPLMVQHGLPSVLCVLSVLLAVGAIPWLALPSSRQPAWLRL